MSKLYKSKRKPSSTLVPKPTKPMTRCEMILSSLKDSGLDDDDLKRLGYKAPRE
jgi:hypothetical protein